MDEIVIQFVQNITWAGVAGLFVWKVVAPLTTFFIRSIANKNGLSEIDKIKNNDLHEIKEEIVWLRTEVDKLREGQAKLRERLARVETKLNSNKWQKNS